MRAIKAVSLVECYGDEDNKFLAKLEMGALDRELDTYSDKVEQTLTTLLATFPSPTKIPPETVKTPKEQSMPERR